MKQGLYFIITIIAIVFASCTRELRPYTYFAYDANTKSVIIYMDTPITQKEFLHTAMYVLDSTNHELKLNKHDKMGIIIFPSKEVAEANDTSKMIGKYEYYFDTKEQIIDFRFK